MNYTVDWTSSHIPNWTTYLKPLFGSKPTKMLEIGVFEGRSAVWFLDNILNHPDSKYVGIDPYAYIDRNGLNCRLDRHRKNMVKNFEPYGDKVEMFIELSEKRLPKLLDEKFDIIRVDGLHTAMNAIFDIVLSWKMLKNNGLLIVDDYDSKDINNWKGNCPKTAMDGFVKCLKDNEWKWAWSGYEAAIFKGNPFELLMI